MHDHVWATALWLSFGRQSSTSLGFAALSLRLTGGPFACRVHSIQQHQEEEVGHGVVLERKLTALLLVLGETRRADRGLLRDKSEGR